MSTEKAIICNLSKANLPRPYLIYHNLSKPNPSADYKLGMIFGSQCKLLFTPSLNFMITTLHENFKLLKFFEGDHFSERICILFFSIDKIQQNFLIAADNASDKLMKKLNMKEPN